MRRADPTVLTPREREERLYMLEVLMRVKEAIRLCEDGETDLPTAVHEIAAALPGPRDRP